MSSEGLVKQLRNTQWYVQDGQLHDICRGYNDPALEAANRIEALEAALRDISEREAANVKSGRQSSIILDIASSVLNGNHSRSGVT